MTTKLKNYFPMIRERKEVLAEIRKSRTLQTRFDIWDQPKQETFLDFCTGVRGLKLLYDGFFKEIMNPEYVPERLNDFLSHMLNQKVRVLKVLPADSVRIAEESSLLVMDIVVELEDGSIANLEVQKIGYLFPGQRSACYSADLLLRQYRRIRNETDALSAENEDATVSDDSQEGDSAKKKKFNYHNIKSVYTIVLFEKSPKEFHNFPDKYCHFFEQKSDTGLKLELLQKYLFIPLDIFLKNKHNVDINVKRDAWLTLFSSDDPDDIIRLIEIYPEFRKIYEEGYQICLNIEGVMDMFSEELYELDRNTVEYMIDEMQETIDKQNQTIDNQSQTISEQSQALDERNQTIDEQNRTINGQNQTINNLKSTIDQLKSTQEQAIRNAVIILKELNLSDSEIIARICSQYQLDKKEVLKYL